MRLVPSPTLLALVPVAGALVAAPLACSSDEGVAERRVFSSSDAATEAAPAADVLRDGPDPKATLVVASAAADEATGAALTTDGRVVVTGTFEGAIPFGPVTLSSGATSGRDGFIAFFDENNKPAAGVVFPGGRPLVLRGAGNSVDVVASFRGSVPLAGQTLDAVDGRDIALMRFRGDASLEGKEVFGGPGDDEILAAGAGPDGDVALSVSGQLALDQGKIVAGTTPGFHTMLRGAGGDLKWLRSSTASVTVFSVGAAKNGAVVAALAKVGDDLGGGPLVGSGTEGGRSLPAFARFAGAGGVQRSGVVITGGPDPARGVSVLTDTDATVYMAIAAKGTVTYGRDAPGEGGVTVLAIDATGATLWAKRVGGPAVPPVPRLRVDASGDLVVLSAADDVAVPVVGRISKTGQPRSAIKLKPIANFREAVDLVTTDTDWLLVGHVAGSDGARDAVVVRYPAL